MRGRYGGYRLAPGYKMPPLMLTDEEALAVLLGLVAGQRAGLVTTSVAAAESAAAKVRRVLPEALGRRLDALLATADFTARARPAVTPETGVLLTLADAARQRRPVAITYTSWDGRRSERTVHPYGLVAHSGRWYVTGSDSASGDVRTFRLDRIETATEQPGTFEVPAEFNSADRVLSGLAEVPRAHEVSVRVQGTAEQVRSRFPAGIATIDELPSAWVRVKLLRRAEHLDWIPSVLAWLDRPFVIEYPDALRDQVHALARRLTSYAASPATPRLSSSTEVAVPRPKWSAAAPRRWSAEERESSSAAVAAEVVVGGGGDGGVVACVVVAVMTGWVVFTGFDEPPLVALLLALAAAFELLAAAAGPVPLVPGLDPALAELAALAARWAVGTGEPLTLGALVAVVPCVVWCESRLDSMGVRSAVTPPATTSTASAAAPAMTLRDGRCPGVPWLSGRPSPSAPASSMLATCGRSGGTAPAIRSGGKSAGEATTSATVSRTGALAGAGNRAAPIATAALGSASMAGARPNSAATS